MKRQFGAVVLSGMWLWAATAGAHHSMEYIDMESYSTEHAGGRLFYLQYDYKVEDQNHPGLDRWEITPGFSYGVTDRLMLDVHAHFAKFGIDHVEEDHRAQYEPHGPSPFMEAVALGLQYRLTEGWPVDVALAGKWEIPFSRAKTLLGSDDHVCKGTLILSRDFAQHANICVNIGLEFEGSDTEWDWAVGGKLPISADPHGVCAGLEVDGDFEGRRLGLLPGVFVPLMNDIIFKSGIGVGWEKDDGAWLNTLRAHVSLMMPF